MNIMFYYGTLYMGGAERVISSLANNFVKRGDKVSIMVTDSLPAGYELDPGVRFINQNAEASSTGIIDAVRNNIRQMKITRKYLLEINPDVVFCFGINNLTLCLLAGFGMNMKIISSERSNPYHADDGRFWTMMKQIISPFADGYVFSTEGARNYYPKRTQRKSTVIPNGIFADTIPDTVEPLGKRKGRVVCSSGRLHPVKGFDILIRAFAMFHEDFPEYSLHIYGEGEEREALEKLVCQLSLEDSVFLEGHVTDIPRKLCENYIYGLASLHEGMPNALIEAMSCGLPCVAANCDFGPGELIKDGENGLLVPVGDVEAMAKAMGRIAGDVIFAEKLAENARNIYQTHSAEKISNQFHDYIISILEKR